MLLWMSCFLHSFQNEIYVESIDYVILFQTSLINLLHLRIQTEKEKSQKMRHEGCNDYSVALGQQKKMIKKWQ